MKVLKGYLIAIGGAKKEETTNQDPTRKNKSCDPYLQILVAPQIRIMPQKENKRR
jgi:hypothetical protein